MASCARRSFAAALVWACASASACFFDWELPAGFEAGDGGDASIRDTASEAEGGSPDSPFDVGPPPPPPPPPDASPDSAPKPCAPGSCAPGFYCSVPGNKCSESGVCTPVPPACAGAGAPATLWCGCTGSLYDRECDVYAKQDSLNAMGGCSGVDSNHYACGYLYCLGQKTACVTNLNKSGYACVDPTAFGCTPPPTCACLMTASGLCPLNAVADCQEDGGVFVACKQ